MNLTSYSSDRRLNKLFIKCMNINFRNGIKIIIIIPEIELISESMSVRS